MIRLYLLSLLVIVAALLVASYLGFPADPGYLLIWFGPYTFETTLFALLTALLILFLLWRILAVLLQTLNPRRLLRTARSRRLAHKSNHRSTED